jgi:formamidopyrimidine-DNA glycosylase
LPELPEVEVVRRGLQEHVVGRRIGAVAVLHPRTARRQPGGGHELAAGLVDRQVIGSGRRGKFLWLATDDPPSVLVAHLGMSGQFRVVTPAGDELEPRHLRARFGLDDGALLFLDQRTFGWLAVRPLVADRWGRQVPDLVVDIAPDPTEAAFDAAAAARAMRTHRVEVKRLLLDQSIVSGIGNIYADEALWRAGVHPRRRADRMRPGQLVQVLDAAVEVMAAALAAGGTSFDGLYVNVNGASGYFSRGLSVYGRAGQPCPRCGAAIVRERFTNRSSHFCPACQRAPRGSH